MIPSLCDSCRQLRNVVTPKGSRFLLCQLSLTDPSYPKYPPQPVMDCNGFQKHEQVRLRPVQPGDLPEMFQWQLDPESNRMAVVNPRTREDFDAHWDQALKDPAIAAKAILADNVFVGFISFFPRDGHNHVGYWIDRAFWGRGVASRALQLFLQEVHQRPLIATAATSNGASLRILQKCGFILERMQHSPGSERYPECEEAVFILST
jgi:RimJ/RimL family protein N-acetyltransferase